MRKFFDFFLVRGVLAYALLAIFGYCFCHAQPPAWLNRGSSPAAPVAVVGEPANPQARDGGVLKPKFITKVVERVKHDTITFIQIDTVIRIDTIYPKASFYNYTIYYEMVNKKFAMQKSFLWDYSNTAQKTQLQSSDTTLLNLGNESLREASYTYDPNGNKTQTFEKIIEGLDMRVNGSNVNITYRTGSSLLFLHGKFDNTGLLMLSSDFSKRRYFLYFIPVDFLFGSEKYTLFLRVEKTEVK